MESFVQSTNFLYSEPEPNNDHRCIGQGCQYCKRRRIVISHPEGEPNNDGHRCFGPGCPGCKTPKRRSRMISRPDSTRTPNHHCMGPGCPRCNTKGRTSTLQTRSTLHKCYTKRRAPTMSVEKNRALPSVSFYEACSLFSGSSQFSNLDVAVTGSSHSLGETPHHCRDFPCNDRGKGNNLNF